MMAWQKICSLKGNRHLVWFDDTEYWALALKINQNNAEFQYSSALWENSTELNSNVYDLNSVQNNKYWIYSNLPADVFLIDIGGVTRRFELQTAYLGKTLLWLQQQALNAGGTFRTPEQKFKNPKGFVNSASKVWTMDHKGGDDIYNITEPVFGKTAQGYSYIRAGVPCDNTHGTETSGSSHGLGLHQTQYAMNINSGQIQWTTSSWWYKAIIWVKIDPKLMRKLGITDDQSKIKIPLPPPRHTSRASDTSCYSERRAA